MNLKRGANGAEVSKLKAKLNILGAGLSDAAQNAGVFGPRVEQAVKQFQRSRGLLVDGVVGPKTAAEIELAVAAALENATKSSEGKPLPAPSKSEYWGATWVGANIDLLGRHESDPLLNARYVPEWKKVGLPGYKTLVGTRHAWCAIRVSADKRKVGADVKGLNAGARSLSKYGRKCPFWFGAELDIIHRGGGRHAATFLYWIDEAKKLCASLDGNRSNRFAVNVTDLSGKGDKLISGPRWPNNWPDGQFVTKAEVLKRYPFLKVGGSSVGGSTR